MIGLSIKKKNGDFLRQLNARANCICEQVDLSVYGIKRVDIGVPMWSLSGSVPLYISPEYALMEIGFSVIITIEGLVFVEPWKQV